MTIDQLRRLGASPGAIKHRVKVGRLHPIHRGVYAVGHPELSIEGAALAAARSIGPDAVVSHFITGHLWTIWDGRSERHVVDVTVARRPRSRPGIRVHAVRRLPPEDVTTLRGVPLTTPLRTLIDLAEVLRSDRALLRCVNQAQVERLVTEAEIGERITAAVGRRGAARLARLLRLGTGPARSTLEDELLLICRQFELPAFQSNEEVHANGRWVEVDFLFREQRLVVESDGDRFHSTRIARRFDAEKQADLELAGYRVIRISWEQATERPEETARRIRTALGQPASGS